MSRMSKRIICLALMLCLVISQMAHASTDDYLNDTKYPATLAAVYSMWADLFGVKTLTDDFDVQFDEKGKCHVYIDLLGITCDGETSAFIEGMLIYKYSGYSDTEMDLRAMALFAAIEYGWMKRDSTDEVRAVREVALATLNKMKQAMIDYNDGFQRGEMIPFFIGNETIYSIMQFSDGTQVIIFD